MGDNKLPSDRCDVEACRKFAGKASVCIEHCNYTGAGPRFRSHTRLVQASTAPRILGIHYRQVPVIRMIEGAGQRSMPCREAHEAASIDGIARLLRNMIVYILAESCPSRAEMLG